MTLVLVHLIIAAALFCLCDWLSKIQAGHKPHGRLKKPFLWIAGSTVLFTVCDYLSRIWGLGGESSWLAFVLILLIAPCAYYCFGRVTRDSGLAIGSSVINASNVITSILVGLVWLLEWRDISLFQYVGMVFAFLGILLMCFSGAVDELPVPQGESATRTIEARFALLFALPLAYFFFGKVTAAEGLALGAGVMNCMNLLFTLLIGLIALQEWRRVSLVQYTGMMSAAAGIVLMLFF